MNPLATERNSEEDEKNLLSKKMFGTLKFPEKSKRFMKLTSNIKELDESVAIFEDFINKNRPGFRTNKKNNQLSPLTSLPNKNINENINKRMTTLNNDSSRKKRKLHECKSIKNIQLTPDKKKEKENLKTNIISKKQKLSVTKTMNNKNNNSNETFLTRVDLPSITNYGSYTKENKKEDFGNKIYKLINKNNEKSKDNIINSNPNRYNDSLYIKKLSYSNNNKKIFINRNANSFQSSKNNNQKQKNEDLSHLINLIYNKNKKNQNSFESEKKSSSKKEKENIETENNKSTNMINNKNNKILLTEPNILENQNNNRDNKYISLSCFKENSARLPPIEKLEKMKLGNNKINSNIKQSCFEYDLINWEVKSKFKYIEWKYGIAEIQKYFIDLKEFGQKEENELQFRKSFYENVEDVIKEIQKNQDKKKKVFSKNNNNINKGKFIRGKFVLDDNEINEYDRCEAINKKRKELINALKKNFIRTKKEKVKRNLIDDILYKCKKSIYNINNRSQNEI